MRILLTSIIVLIASFTNIHSQYRSPMDIPLVLSANFGELRNNHFHSGIDLKTQGVINKPVYSIADGYISRISISPSGYGLAIYVDHPSTGQTSVYAHINKFPSHIEKYIREEQYKQESFKVNLYPKKDKFAIKKGDLIAYSGNSGSSGGPHVHFEIRDTKSESIIDPLPYYKANIADNVAPELRGIAVYPIEHEGLVNGSNSPYRRNISRLKNGSYPTIPSIQAWGKIGVGVKAYDRMSKTTNIYGVKIVRLFVDGKEIFSSDIQQYSFDETRMLNSFVDFADWRNQKSFFMKSFIEPGNTLPFYKSVNNGYLTIDQEKTYDIKYELEDLYGNKTQYSFSIVGKKQVIPQDIKCSLYMPWNVDNRFIKKDFSLIIPKGNLYDNICFNLRQFSSTNYLSDVYQVNTIPVPLQGKADISIALTKDELSNKKQYGIVALSGKSVSWVGGSYSKGMVKANINELGKQYAISSDTESPKITPVKPEIWVKDKKIKIRLTDNLSGVESFRGTINGKFVLFTHDVKSPVYTYTFDDRIKQGETQDLIFTATDACGNQAEYTYQFSF